MAINERPTVVSTKKILGLMLLAMAFVTLALLYVTGPSVTATASPIRDCKTVGGGPCFGSRRTTAWERVWFAVVGE
jgi:hypothetical protein